MGRVSHIFNSNLPGLDSLKFAWSLGIVSNAERRIPVGSPHGKRRHGV